MVSNRFPSMKSPRFGIFWLCSIVVYGAILFVRNGRSWYEYAGLAAFVASFVSWWLAGGEVTTQAERARRWKYALLVALLCVGAVAVGWWQATHGTLQ